MKTEFNAQRAKMKELFLQKEGKKFINITLSSNLVPRSDNKLWSIL